MRPGQFSIIRVMIDGGREVCLRLSGDLDADASDELRHELYDAVHDNRAPLLVVDLHEAAYLCSEVVGALLEGFRQARDAGKGVQIVNVRGAVRTVLQVTGVLDLFGASPASSAGLTGDHGARVLPFPAPGAVAPSIRRAT